MSEIPNRSPNPYQPPTSLPEPEGWWVKTLAILGLVPREQRSPDATFFNDGNLRKGEVLIFGGIAFFVLSDDATDHNASDLYAVSPSADHSDERLELIANEAIGLLPDLVNTQKRLQTFLDGRGLKVRIVDSYADCQTSFVRERRIDHSTLRNAMNANEETFNRNPER